MQGKPSIVILDNGLFVIFLAINNIHVIVGYKISDVFYTIGNINLIVIIIIYIAMTKLNSIISQTKHNNANNLNNFN